MKKALTLIAAGVALATSGTAAATQAATRTFEHGGLRYTYSTAAEGDVRILSGVIENSGRPFYLKVAKGRVRGTINGQRVSFRLSDVERLKTSTEIAAR